MLTTVPADDDVMVPEDPVSISPSAQRPGWLAEQIDFYDADTVAFSDWLDRLRDGTNTEPDAIAFRSKIQTLASMLARVQPRGRILEIAAGTGAFSTLIAPHADELVLLDASAASLRLARANLAAGGHQVTLVHADIFSWTSTGASFDVICFAAWLHHVPLSHFDRFWSLVDTLLVPGGLVLFDFAHPQAPLPSRCSQPPEQPSVDFAAYHDPARELSVRDLGGRRWRVVHRLWEPEALARRLSERGWAMHIEVEDPTGFHWATARRAGAKSR